jgi:hypothetical protein
MSQEINPINPVSFLGVPELRLLQTETGEQQPVFVGGVLYHQGKNALVFGEQNHRLLVSPLDPEQNSDFVSALKDTSRILSLNTFTDVAVRQVGINGIAVKKNQSIYQQDPLSIEFWVHNPETNEKEKISVGQDDLLDIFSGEKGGIAVFSGKGFPEETGLQQQLPKIYLLGLDKTSHQELFQYLQPLRAAGAVVSLSRRAP